MPDKPASSRFDIQGAVGRTFLTGVAVAVPFLVTVAALWWFAMTVDRHVRDYVPGLPAGVAFAAGLGLALVGLFVLGLLTRLFFVRWMLGLGEWALTRIPLAKTLYEATRDLMRFFGGANRGQLGQVVRVSLDGGRVRLLGLLTNPKPRGDGPVPEGQTARVAVYLPMSYQIGGFTIYVRPEDVEPLPLSVEQAMKIAATADVG